MSDKQSFAEQVASQLIEQLEAGTAPWLKPWKAGELERPYNAKTGNAYNGGNSLNLMMQQRGDPRWLTYKQATEIGAQVRKGATGTPIQFVAHGEERVKRDANGQPIKSASGESLKEFANFERPRIYRAVVFNGEQIDNMPAREIKELGPEPQRHERAEAIMQLSGVPFSYGGDRAFYSPSADRIQMPGKHQFETQDAFYATAMHELGHATGHKTRLDRDLSNPFGSEGYAKEELRAEIASLMVGMTLGIGHDPGQHAAYCASWVKVLKDDPNEIMRAAADAEKIHGFVLGLEKTQAQNQENEATGDNQVRAGDAIASPEQGMNPIVISDGPQLTPDELVATSAQIAASKENPMAMTKEKIYLVVQYAEKDAAKSLGVKWDPSHPNPDPTKKPGCWFAPAGTSIEAIKKWLPENQTVEAPQRTTDPIKEFGEALKAAQLEGGVPIMDGKPHRMRAEGDKPREQSGFYIGHIDGHPNGTIVNNRTGVETKWSAKGSTNGLTNADLARLNQEAKAKTEKRDAERAVEKERVSIKVSALIETLKPADQNHPYLVAKNLQGSDTKGIYQDKQNRLIVPVHDSTGKVWTLQHIDAKGEKGFEAGGAFSGNYHKITSPQKGGGLGENQPIVIAEGYATAKTINDATGGITIAALAATNLKAVAEAIRKEHPDRGIVIAGDNDHAKEAAGQPNIGRAKAKEAAASVGGVAATPSFDAKEKGTDWNDFAANRGGDAMKVEMAKALIDADQRMLMDAMRTGHDSQGVEQKIQADLQGVQRGSMSPSGKAEFNLAAIKGAMNQLHHAAEKEVDKQEVAQEQSPQQQSRGKARTR